MKDSEILTSTQWEIATSIFSENQKTVIENVIITGFWGDTDINFNGNENHNYAYGYYTNETDCEYKGKQLSGIFSGIAKVIKDSNSKYFLMASNWWGDGSGDMLFINMDMFNENNL